MTDDLDIPTEKVPRVDRKSDGEVLPPLPPREDGDRKDEETTKPERQPRLG